MKDEVHKNNKQKQLVKHKEVSKLLLNAYVECRGNEICCGEFKSINDFSPSSKDCAKIIRENNRKQKISNAEDRYIIEKIRNNIYRVGIIPAVLKCSESFFVDWIKYQSTDTFSEHLDHVIPLHYFRQFSPASKFLTVRDSWLNIMPLDAKENIKKSSKVDFDLFQDQLIKAKYFIANYNFISDDEKDDSIEYYKIIERRIKQLIKISQI
jgi:hypothetical protein